jgi:hypothetical protein
VTAADPLRRKALQCLREGRTRVIQVSGGVVVAVVRSSRDGHPYNVEYNPARGDLRGGWSCDCREGRRELPCAHTLAVALVTTGSTT